MMNGSGGGQEMAPDRAAIADFAGSLFPYADEGGVVSVRAFFDDEEAKRKGARPFSVESFRLNGSGLDPLIDVVFRTAQKAAQAERPVVVAPPIVTLEGRGAGEKNLREGLVLSVELDRNPEHGLAVLRGCLGPPTVVVASGGAWTDPATGEVVDKLHCHWRLNEPTRTAEEHARLKLARELAAELAGGDKSAVPLVHPMRWAGTLHRKNPAAARLAQIIELNHESEITLGDALDELQGWAAIRAEGQQADNVDWAVDDDPDLLAACAERMPNPDLDWHAWNRLGLAFWAASDGSEAGFAAFDVFSRKSTKHDAAATLARWKHYTSSKPDRIGIGTLVHEARKTDPGFRKARAKTDQPKTEKREPLSDWRSKLQVAIDEMNDRHFVVPLGGQTVIATLETDDALQRDRLVYSREQDIRLLYKHRSVVVGLRDNETEIRKDLGTAWIENPRRRTYRRVALIPKGSCPADTYNLWRGYGVHPKDGDWGTIEHHLRQVICSGDRANFDWLTNWMAYTVQNPDKQAEVAAVLRGEKGVGKGLVGQMLMRIFRDHALHISNGKHLTGNFNSHLADVLFLFVDEAFWAGDKQGESVLKALVTEDRLMIEPKHVNGFNVRNLLKILISANEDWVVPATGDERRYFVLDVPSTMKGDKAYFDKLAAAINGDELDAFLGHLLQRDLSEFDHRNPPHTAALNKQKLHGLDSVQRFWFDCLSQGEIVDSLTDGWPETIEVKEFHAAFLQHAQDHGDRHLPIASLVNKKLSALLPDGETLPTCRPRLQEGPRPRHYLLPALKDARAAFCTAMRIASSDAGWSDDDA
jgi:hypothetical protein